jgi:hypothetical protein
MPRSSSSAAHGSDPALCRAGGAWLGSGEDDPSGDCATGFAEQLAAALRIIRRSGPADMITAAWKPARSATISVK